MSAVFDRAVLEALAAVEEVTIETRRLDGTPRRTIIWVVVDGSDVLIRSVRGQDGRWYRDLLREPAAALVEATLPGGRLAVLAAAATDERSIERCSRAFRAKYPPWGVARLHAASGHPADDDTAGASVPLSRKRDAQRHPSLVSGTAPRAERWAGQEAGRGPGAAECASL